MATVLDEQSGAKFSRCLRYRYALWRRWAWHGYPSSIVMFIGLNPSTADETINDPTIRRCIDFAKRWDRHGLVMMNAYAYRATNPKDMLTTTEPIGELNDDELIRRAADCDLLVAAWGNHCSTDRQEQVCRLLNRRIMCLGKTNTGRPRHPLYLKKETPLELFWEPTP